MILSTVKIALLLLIVIGVPLYLYFFKLDWMKGFKDIESIVAFLNQYKSQSILIYIVFQVVQIVVSVIPGQVFQMAAGYLFGFWAALLYAMIGAVIGTMAFRFCSQSFWEEISCIFFSERRK